MTIFAVALSAFELRAQTTETSDPLHPVPPPPPTLSAVAWLTGIVGPTSYGGGGGMRWKYVGIGFSSFHVDRDNPGGIPPRPGGWAFSMELYGYWDALDWLAFYGDLGLVGRSSTDAADQKIADAYSPRDVSAYGIGGEVTLLRRLVLGGGYQIIIPSNDDGLEYDNIASAILHIGYRF
ncbi:MAG: hypothetical protein ABIQ57_00930 [Candidatus Kapaibacterium sp.]